MATRQRSVQITLADWQDEPDAVLGRPGRGWTQQRPPAELLEFNRGWWRLSADQAKGIGRVELAHGGVVVAVGTPSGGVIERQDGRVAWEHIEPDLEDTRIGRTAVPSSGNPIRYLDVDTEPPSEVDPTTWVIEPGASILRKELHSRFGGRTQGGIGPSAQSPNVFIFSEPKAGEPHGYVDGWKTDRCFHYTGEGQHGDQRMIQGNKAILNHVADGRALRVFDGVGGAVTYVGEFIVDPDQPYYLSDAPETGGGPVRQVIVFRLRPLEGRAQAPTQGSTGLPTADEVRPVPIEERHTERVLIEPSRAPYKAERTEAALVDRYKAHLRALGHEVSRNQIRAQGERNQLYTDLHDTTDDVLIEAKGSASREAVRMAIGQLADYSRFVKPRGTAILLPSEPRADLLALIASTGTDTIWETPDGFVRRTANEVSTG